MSRLPSSLRFFARARNRALGPLVVTPAWLWLVVLAELAIPSSYYLWRSDAEDERFAWRMFSAMRLRRCELSARETVAGQQHPLELQHELHASWLGALQRGRQPVIDKFLTRHCVHHPVDAVILIRRCTEVDGQQLPERRYVRDCHADRVAGQEATGARSAPSGARAE